MVELKAVLVMKNVIQSVLKLKITVQLRNRLEYLMYKNPINFLRCFYLITHPNEMKTCFTYCIALVN